MSLDLKSTNAGLLKPATVMVSTVSLPSLPGMRFTTWRYETCVFSGDGLAESDVVETYDSIVAATRGHARHCVIHGVKP
jgi:hypothetical protein